MASGSVLRKYVQTSLCREGMDVEFPYFDRHFLRDPIKNLKEVYQEKLAVWINLLVFQPGPETFLLFQFEHQD